jgi:hypothetical protein
MLAVLRLAMTSLAVARLKRGIDNFVVHAILLALAAVLATTAAGFLLSAGWLVLAAEFTPIQASMIIGVALLAVAGIIVIAARMRKSRASRHMVMAAAPMVPVTPMPTLREANLASVLIVAGIGYLAGRLLLRR